MSHHSSEDRSAEMSALMRQVFGEFPDGKLNAQDEGALAMSVSQEKGVVKLAFPKPVAWIGFPPQQAIEVAELLIQHARAIARVSGQKLTVNL